MALASMVVARCAASSATTLPPRQNDTWSEGGGEDDDAFYHNLSFREYMIGLIGILTAAVAPYSFVVGVPGVALNRCPIEYPPPDGWCGFGRRCPTHWSPMRLCAANVLGAVASGLLCVSSLLLALKFDSWFLGVVGAAVNGSFCLLCAVAAKQLYEPRYKLKRILRAVFQDDTLFADL